MGHQLRTSRGSSLPGGRSFPRRGFVRQTYSVRISVHWLKMASRLVVSGLIFGGLTPPRPWQRQLSTRQHNRNCNPRLSLCTAIQQRTPRQIPHQILATSPVVMRYQTGITATRLLDEAAPLLPSGIVTLLAAVSSPREHGLAAGIRMRPRPTTPFAFDGARGAGVAAPEGQRPFIRSTARSEGRILKSLRHGGCVRWGQTHQQRQQADLSWQYFIPPAHDIAQHPTDERSRRHLLLSDRARGRCIDQWRENFDDADAKAAHLPPQRHRKGIESSFGRGIGRRAGCRKQGVPRGDHDDHRLSARTQEWQKASRQQDRAGQIHRDFLGDAFVTDRPIQ